MQLDFVIIGAEKAGTTLLADRLRLSPAIAIPVQEVRHFRDPFYPDHERIGSYFAADETRLKGIKHPSYLGRPEAPPRLAAHNPALKLVALLREPAARTIASYLHYTRTGQIPLLHPNQGIPAMLANPDAAPKYRDILALSGYADAFTDYLAHFRPTQIHVASYERFIADRAVLDGVCAFIGVDTPAAAWPLPRVNPGSYDWRELAHAHADAQARNIYDNAMNIIGQRDAAPSSLERGDPQPIVIAPEVRRALHTRFAREGERLMQLGLFTESPWPHQL